MLNLPETNAFRVKDEISQLIDWHRSEELPQYADQLEKLSKELKSGITVEPIGGIL